MFKGTWSASSQHWVSRQLLFTTADTHALLHTCAQLSVRALGDQNVLPCVLFLIETLSPSTSANIKKKLPEDLFLSPVPSHKAPYLWETLRFPFKKLSRLYFPQLCLSSWQTRKFSPASPRAVLQSLLLWRKSQTLPCLCCKVSVPRGFTSFMAVRSRGDMLVWRSTAWDVQVPAVGTQNVVVLAGQQSYG